MRKLLGIQFWLGLLTNRWVWHGGALGTLGMLGLLWAAVAVLPSYYQHPPQGQRQLAMGEASRQRLPERCRVLVWNIYKGDKPNFTDDFAALANDCDLVLMQEYHATDNVVSAMRGTQLQFDIGVSFLFRRDKSATGVATGCSVCAIDKELFISPQSEPLTGTPKASLLTSYPLGDHTQPLMVANLHGLNIAGFAALKKQLEPLAARLIAHKGPAILAGDFNTNTSEKQKHVRELAERLGMREMEFDPDGRMTAPFSKMPLDYVFYRGLAIEEASVCSERDGSDHKAMAFTITDWGSQESKFP